jgi:hypothetical protein
MELDQTGSLQRALDFPSAFISTKLSDICAFLVIGKYRCSGSLLALSPLSSLGNPSCRFPPLQLRLPSCNPLSFCQITCCSVCQSTRENHISTDSMQSTLGHSYQAHEDGAGLSELSQEPTSARQQNTGNRTDQPENPFSCNICKRSYSRIDHLARHHRSRL